MKLDVVIVGGGAAGIAAARCLSGRHLTALLIEAAPHLGGRAHTLDIDGMPLDLGCGWLHSADRNPWVAIGAGLGMAVDRRAPAWGRQYRDLGFPPADYREARQALDDWIDRLADDPPASDDAAEALPSDPRWHPYISAMTGFISGVAPGRISAADFTAYDQASTDANWRVVEGYGRLVASSMPADIAHRCGVALQSLSFGADGVRLDTSAGPIEARTAILTVSTAVLADDRLGLPHDLDPWREAAARLPLGHNEKLFLGIGPGAPFQDETQLLGNPRDAGTASYYIRPLGRPVIEGFLGGEGARLAAREGDAAAFAHAIDELAALMGSGIRAKLVPLVASAWTRDVRIGGGYSCALPGAAGARRLLARPFGDRLFFAGEATSTTDFSTAHGAYCSGVRAARETIEALGRRPA